MSKIKEWIINEKTKTSILLRSIPATVMTLFVIPVVYDIVCKNELDIVSDDDLVILDI